MSKKLSKILIAFFLIIFIFQIFSLIFLLLSPGISNAADVKFKPQITIGKFKKCDSNIMNAKEYEECGETISGTSIGEYINAIYKYSIGIVGILAAVVLMFGGVLWLTAGGNSERISNAKSWIGASLTGLVLVLASYMILSMINPDLVNFEALYVKKVDPIVSGCCLYTENNSQKAANMTNFDCGNKNRINFDKNKFASGGTKCLAENEMPGCCVIKYLTGIIITSSECSVYQNTKKWECSPYSNLASLPNGAKNIKYKWDKDQDGSCAGYTQPLMDCFGKLKN